MKTVVVTKTGSPCFVGMKGSARGDADTPSIVEHLCARGDIDVCYFGSCRNWEEGWKDLDVTVFDPYLGDIVNEASVQNKSCEPALIDRLDPFVADLQNGREIVAWIDCFGGTPSWSWPVNPLNATTQVFAVAYAAPALYAMHKTGGPRFAVVTDPKVYKRDGEMMHMWPEVFPKAVLSQEQRTWKKKISYNDVMVHAKYAACEFWLTHLMEPIVRDKQWDLTIAANAHFNEGRLPRDRDHLWYNILSLCDPERTRICGKGWEKAPQLYSEFREMFVGVLPDMDAVREFMAIGIGSPVIPQMPGFNSTKPRLHALSGSVPYLFGDGLQTMTYDRDARILPLNHPARWTIDGGDPILTDAQISETIELVLERTRPDFSVLDDLVDHALAGQVTWPDPAWLERFGGYVKI